MRALQSRPSFFPGARLYPGQTLAPSDPVSRALRHLLWYLIAGTRGGVNRARILAALRERPYNANQLSEALRLDYRTIRHHLELLEKHGLVARPAGEAYAAPYVLSNYMEANYAVFEEIRSEVARSARD